MALSCMDIAEELGDWPNCAVPDCAYKACLGYDSDKCYAHTLGLTPIDPAIYFAEAGEEEAESPAEWQSEWQR